MNGFNPFSTPFFGANATAANVTVSSTTSSSSNGPHSDGSSSMDWNSTSNRIQDFSGRRSTNIQFNFSSLTFTQLQDLKRLLLEEQEVYLLDSQTCKLCKRKFNSSHACRLHQKKTHFNTLHQYRKAYGELFESTLNNVRI
jgi:hypothetical protein